MIDSFEEDRAFILKRTLFREQHYLLDVFHAELGRFRASARIATSPSYRFTNGYALFQEILITGSRKSDLANIRHSEPYRRFTLMGKNQISAYYLNELLLKYLPPDDPAAALYQAYTAALAQPCVATYRSIEYFLLKHLGLLPELQKGGAYYRLSFEHDIPTLTPATTGYSAELITALEEKDITALTAHPQAKPLFQQILHHQAPLPHSTRSITRHLAQMTYSQR